MDLLKLITEEGSKNNALKRAYRDGKFPSEEVARGISSEDLYKIAANSIEFRDRIDIEIIKSSSVLVSLIDIYISECERGELTLQTDLDDLRKLKEKYVAENREIGQGIVNRMGDGYGAHW